MNSANQIRIISSKISRQELQQMAAERFGDLVKGVVDINTKIMALGGELHADEEQLLLQQGSQQENLWGINLYPDLPFPQMVEFDSMINVRPRQGNKSRDVENEVIRQAILEIVQALIA